jgi:hypothetical protein
VLDDYEEGTWTPSVNLLGTIAYGAQTGRYSKIGKGVWLEFTLYYTSTDTTQDGVQMTIGGLPFIVASGSFGSSCMMTERVYATNSATAINSFHCAAAGGTTSAYTYQNNYNAGIASASYFVSNTRSCYKGGLQYMYGQLFYQSES